VSTAGDRLAETGSGSGPSAEPKDRPEGFSLIEVIVVVAVIAILASVAIPVVDLVQSRARGEATLQGMETLRDALDSYFIDHLAFPATLADLETGGYVAGGFAPGAAFRDAWGTDYVYEPGATTVVVRSLGPDQTETAPNLQLTVDGTRHLQARTRVDLETIHLGLHNYESRRMSDSLQALPAVWFDAADPVNCAFGLLVQKGYLLNSARYTKDSWGSPYVYRGSPADYVKSPHLTEAGKMLGASSGPGPAGGSP
jgi:prepilin-type N-terminal cleavage/methylation domain-containing protein